MKRVTKSRTSLARLLVAAVLAAVLAIAGCGSRGSGKQGSSHASQAAAGAERSGGQQFKFIVCGDPQNNYEVFNKILEAAKSVDFILIAGDETGSGTATEFQSFLNDTKNVPVTYYCVPGNHDVVTSPVGQNYTTYLGKPYRSFDHKGSHFVLIDNSTPELGFYPQERAWVRADLAAARKRGSEHAFAVCHVPPGYPYSAKATTAQIPGINANHELAPVLRSGGVQELFCGHVHAYLEEKDDGLPITITGGAGAPLMGIAGDAYYHYVLVQVNGREVTQQVVRI